MDSKTRCIVLRTVKFGDNKLIIDFLTREEGRQSAVWKITTSAKSRIRRQIFQPLTILDIDITRSPRQQMAQLSDARLAMPYTSIPFEGTKLSISFFLAEFLHYATRGTHTDCFFYDFVEQSLIWLDNAQRGIANFHLMFMIRLSHFLGFQPDMSTYHKGALFDLREGVFCSSAPLHRDFLSPSDAEQMQTLMRMSPSNLHLFPLSHNERNRIIDFIIIYYRLHLPEFGEIKSLDVLRAL